MQQKLRQIMSILQKDPAVDTVVGFTGGGQTNSGFMFMSLKPLSERKISADQVIQRLRGELAQVPGAPLFLQAVQDIRVGGRAANAQYQYTLTADNTTDLFAWAPKILAELQKIPQLTEVNSDQQNKGLETDLVIDRTTAARLGITVSEIDNTLYDAFGQRQVSTIYNPRNQYHVIMEAAPKYWQNPEVLKDFFISTSGGAARGTVTGPTAATAASASSACSPASAALPALPSSSSGSRTAATTVTGTTATTGIANTTGMTTTTGAAITTGTATTTGTAATTPGTATSVSSFTPLTSSTPTPAASAAMTPSPAAAPCSSSSTSSNSSASSTSSAAAVASDAVRNQALNSIGNTGNSTASTGAAVTTSAETMIPLSAVSHFGPGNIPLAVNHQDLSVATTISFNLAPGASLSDAVREVDAAMTRLGVPNSIRGTFQGTARVFQESIANEPYLNIVLGILYESYIHPLTILSTLPSAGVGAVLALMLFKTEFSIIGLIGVIMLIGTVKKNAIMMIDFALDAERSRGLSSRDAIYEACLLRLRPILMTTAAAALGALPLAIGMGEGGELRRPLGIAIVGGLIVSQMLTLYTTPVIYLYLDRFSLWLHGLRGGDARIPHAPLVPGE
jgi:multidrug efflux pump